LTNLQGRFPSRRTWERRLAAIPDTLPAQIGCLGRHLVALIQPWTDCARAAAIDSTVLRALGGVWHKKDREAAVVPHTSIDTEARDAEWGWRGWVWAGNFPLASRGGAVLIPAGPDPPPANAADNLQAPGLIQELPLDLRFLLGDQHYRDPALEQLCARSGCLVITPTGGAYPHTDDGVEVRRLLHKTRSIAVEHFTEQFKRIFA